MYDTEKYLSAYIENYYGLFVCKTKDGTFKYVSKMTAKLAGYKSADDLIGRTDYDIRCEAQKFADVFRAEDKEAYHLALLNTIDIMRYSDGELKILYTTRKILQSQDNTVDMCVNGVELPFFILNELYKSKFISGETGSYRIMDAIRQDNLHLTKRETQCLFYLLRGKTAKETAKILNISYRTVEEHCENLKIKFNCPRKSDLMEKALLLGMDHYIPNSFLPNFLFKTSSPTTA